jgi:hypothetical protein
LWTGADGSRLAPGLKCSTALADVSYFDTRRRFLRSDQLDQWHAAYAPYVDVFTCDKRTFDVLTRLTAARASHLRTRIVRASPLAGVLDAVHEVVNGRPAVAA